MPPHSRFSINIISSPSSFLQAYDNLVFVPLVWRTGEQLVLLAIAKSVQRVGTFLQEAMRMIHLQSNHTDHELITFYPESKIQMVW